MHFACSRVHPIVVGLLLDRGVDMDKAGSAGVTPLHYACYRGNLAGARLLPGAGMDTADEDEITPLFDACSEGHLEVTRLRNDRPIFRNENSENTPNSIPVIFPRSMKSPKILRPKNRQKSGFSSAEADGRSGCSMSCECSLSRPLFFLGGDS